jgi:hypothetical protein
MKKGAASFFMAFFIVVPFFVEKTMGERQAAHEVS